jgi:Skp family chaperone for outer membrane proteins
MRKTYLLALFLAASAGLAVAQDTAAPGAAKAEVRSPRVAVIDMARVSAETLLGKGYAAQLDTLKNEIDALRSRAASSESLATEITALKDQRDVIRTRVGEMLEQLEGNLLTQHDVADG